MVLTKIYWGGGDIMLLDFSSPKALFSINKVVSVKNEYKGDFADRFCGKFWGAFGQVFA